MLSQEHMVAPLFEASCTSDDANQWPEGTVGVQVHPEAEKFYWKI
jgi:hypothetical protein